jgi:Pvc16 N-terminal domain
VSAKGQGGRLGTFQAIAATGQAMLGLLADACPRDEFPTAQFELYQLSNFQQSPMEEGVSLYLYRIAANTSRRNLPPTVAPDGRRFRPPIPLDLYYVATAWAPTAVKQQRLLGWTIRMFEDVPILPTGLLNNYGPEPEIFKTGETVELILDSLTLQDLNNLWSNAKNNPPLSVGYIARMIRIESSMPMSEFAEVQTREFGVGKV